MVVDDNWVNLELKGIDTVVLFVNGVTYADGFVCEEEHRSI